MIQSIHTRNKLEETQPERRWWRNYRFLFLVGAVVLLVFLFFFPWKKGGEKWKMTVKKQWSVMGICGDIFFYVDGAVLHAVRLGGSELWTRRLSGDHVSVSYGKQTVYIADSNSVVTVNAETGEETHVLDTPKGAAVQAIEDGVAVFSDRGTTIYDASLSAKKDMLSDRRGRYISVRDEGKSIALIEQGGGDEKASGSVRPREEGAPDAVAGTPGKKDLFSYVLPNPERGRKPPDSDEHWRLRIYQREAEDTAVSATTELWKTCQWMDADHVFLRTSESSYILKTDGALCRLPVVNIQDAAVGNQRVSIISGKTLSIYSLNGEEQFRFSLPFEPVRVFFYHDKFAALGETQMAVEDGDRMRIDNVGRPMQLVTTVDAKAFLIYEDGILPLED